MSDRYTNRNLYQTSKSDPCPVCGDDEGDCRHHNLGEIHLCMHNADAKKFEIREDHKCIGHTKNGGLWGNFKSLVLDTYQKNQQNYDPERVHRQAREKADKELKRKENLKTEIELSLPLEVRDAENRKLLAELEGINGYKLHPDDIADLKRRDFTDQQIIDSGFVSVKKFQKLTGKYHVNLTGISKYNSVVAIDNGYLCPIKNGNGYIVGFQVRLRDSSSKHRYHWLSSREEPNRILKIPVIDYSGNKALELPLAVFNPSEKPTAIYLVEGVAAKPFLTSQRSNLLVIGAAGGQFAGSPVQLLRYISQAFKDYGILPIVLCPDAGDIDKPEVKDRWLKTSEVLAKFGFDYKFAWWNQVKKNDCDIDELENFDCIKFLSHREFFNLQGEKITFYSPKAVNPEALKNWLNWINYTAAIEQNEKFFKLPDNLPKSGVTIGINSTTGTGKTHDILKAIKRRESEGIGAKFISPRIKLNLQLTQRAEKDFDLKIYLLNEDSGIDLLMDSRIHQSLCPESMYKLDGFFTGSDLVIDEAVGVISQILNGGTLQGKNQALALKVFKRAFNECNNILLLDANLNDRLVDLITKLAGNKQSVKIANAYQHEHPQPAIIVDGIDVNEDIKIHDKSALVSKVLKAKKPCIGTDSQIHAQSLAYILRDAGKVGFVLDSKANEENWLQLFERSPELENRYANKLFGLGINPLDFWADRLMKNPDKFFLEFDPDYFIYTPTAESGVSIDLRNFFTCKFLVFFGVIGTDSQIQMSQRLRDTSIPTYIYCPERSVIPRNSSFNQQTPDLMRAALEESLKMWDSDDPDFQKALDFCKARLDESKDWWEYGKNLTAIQNFEFANLRACLSYKLRLMGYTVEVRELEINEDIKEQLKDAKEMILNTEAELIYNSQLFESKEEADRIAKRKSDARTLRRVRKTNILHAHPGLEQSEVWSADYILNCYILDKDFIRSLNNFYLLSNPEIAAIKADYDHYFKITEQFVSQQSLLKDTHKLVFGLRELGILELIELLKSGSEFTKDSEIIKLILSTNRTRKDLKCIPGLKPPRATSQGKETIPYIKLLLGKVGISLKYLGKHKDEDGVRKSFYCLDTAKFNHPYRTVTLDCIQRYFENWKVEKYEVNTPDWAYSAVNNGERKPSIKDSENPDIYLAQQPESIIQNSQATIKAVTPVIATNTIITEVIETTTAFVDQAQEILMATFSPMLRAIAKQIKETGSAAARALEGLDVIQLLAIDQIVEELLGS